jgi:hypothetical protein
MILPDGTGRREAIRQRHARHRNSLLRHVTAVIREVKVHQPPPSIDRNRKVAVPAPKKAILRVTVRRVARFQDDAQIDPARTAIAGQHGANSWRRKTGANAAGLMVVIAEQVASFIEPGRLNPHRHVLETVHCWSHRFHFVELTGTRA